MPIPRLQPIRCFSIGNSGSAWAFSSSFCTSVFDMDIASGSGRERRLDAAEEDPRDQQPDPDHEAEQAHEIDRSELAEAILPKLAEVRQNADREEGENKEDHAERIGLTNRGRELRERRGRTRERDHEPD